MGQPRWIAIAVTAWCVTSAAVERRAMADTKHDCAEEQKDARGDCPVVKQPTPHPNNVATHPVRPVHQRPATIQLNVAISDHGVTKRAPEPPKPNVNPDQLVAPGPANADLDRLASQEKVLTNLLADTPDTADEKADMYFRLSELYAQMYRLNRLKSIENNLTADQKAAYASSAKTNLLKAVKVYKVLTEDDHFRSYAKMDMALFYYGYTLATARYMKEARDVYDKLVKNYPASKFVPQAQLSFADYYFENGQLADAEARYKLVLKYPNSSVYWYAMYKLGWVHINLSRFQDALESFFQVATATKTGATNAALHRAAEKDFVRAFAEIGKVDRAYDAFARLDRDDAYDLMIVLGDLYVERAAYDKALAVYEDMERRATNEKDGCTWLLKIAQTNLVMSAPHTYTQVDVCAADEATLLDWARSNGISVP